MEKMIFLDIGWMEYYKGLTNDSIVGGGSFVQEHGYGEEIFNFLPYDGYMYGFVQVKGSINIERLGASKKDNSIDNVLVIWISKSLKESVKEGVVIIGWYKNATVYRHLQPAPKGSNRRYKGEELRYHIKAKEEDCRLLPRDSRVFPIPTRRKGGLGRSNVWYADNISSSFRQNVLNFVNTEKIPESRQPQIKNEKPWQPDPYKRQQIEKIAIELTTKHYKDLGYVVDSVEKDNMGWDLEASLDNKLLRLEVKGLSQEEILIELTPNEYDKMKKYKDSYRIAVVTNALGENPSLKILSFSPESERWEDEQGNPLNISERVSARINL